ncbi:peptidase M4 [Pseudomonas fluorescens]|uniref:Peptidase M4 n=1 Tax=Pseudomonas fluorescens TaxID=294 RepID=A0A5E7FA85_PSEFL|nr:peptidase M4 [Pseudomonas fluorescens]VVO34947.1 hypothetical protein PS723_05299 [Pseudomonas fluorescens]
MPKEPKRPGEGVDFCLAGSFGWLPSPPYQRDPADPLYRPLRIYTVDPSVRRLEGAIGTINVPFERFKTAGLSGCLFRVEHRNTQLGLEYRQADLDELGVLIANGYEPSPSDPRFHQQMVYAVSSNIYMAFKLALGRDPSWGFGNEQEPVPLTLHPHYGENRNAYYTQGSQGGEIRFGYFKASDTPSDRSLPGGYVFTCLSHDIISHEVTHALLDGLRPCFSLPLSVDVPAFHEAFADLVAIFQHFSYREVLIASIRRCKGNLLQASLLTQLAQQFGHTTGKNGPLRNAIEINFEQPRQYKPDLEVHELGSILVSALFEAFAQIFERKSARYIRLATNGCGILPPGDLSHDLQVLLAEKASKLARQFLTICIRAIDYCPPTAINFGDYLRALITADYDVLPDDTWDYRGAIIDSFRRRNIYPRTVTSLSEDALLWRAPRIDLPRVSALDFASLRFEGDPAHCASPQELRRQAGVLGMYVSRPEHLAEFGLVAADDRRLQGDSVSLPCVQSIRTLRRVGPDQSVTFDLVAEVTQKRHVKASGQGPAFTYQGGSTVLISPVGKVRYVILKSVGGDDRLERRRSFLTSAEGQKYWRISPQGYSQIDEMFRLVHEGQDP